MQLGKPTTHCYINPDYKTWGTGGSSGRQFKMRRVSVARQANSVSYIRSLLSLDDYPLIDCHEVDTNEAVLQPTTALLYRFQHFDAGQLGDPHVSVLWDDQQQCLLGLTRMQQPVSGLLEHQQALEVAHHFLQQHCPDLVDMDANLRLIDCKSDDRLVFSPVVRLGQLQLHWIDRHSEHHHGVTLTGMKVKYYRPDNDTWLWVIVDAEGQVMTFERDIRWQYQPHRRLSPMWLHDRWLCCQPIVVR